MAAIGLESVQLTGAPIPNSNSPVILIIDQIDRVAIWIIHFIPTLIADSSFWLLRVLQILNLKERQKDRQERQLIQIRKKTRDLNIDE